MCLLVLHVSDESSKNKIKYRIILGSNRDEDFSRPSNRAHFWDSKRNNINNILAGKV